MFSCITGSVKWTILGYLTLARKHQLKSPAILAHSLRLICSDHLSYPWNNFARPMGSVAKVLHLKLSTPIICKKDPFLCWRNFTTLIILPHILVPLVWPQIKIHMKDEKKVHKGNMPRLLWQSWHISCAFFIL